MYVLHYEYTYGTAHNSCITLHMRQCTMYVLHYEYTYYITLNTAYTLHYEYALHITFTLVIAT